jgi:carbamoyl-phosphate synthase small subunit
VSEATAYVLLEDGTRFDGLACGAAGTAVGEVVFTTGMTGYQEAMTDPSFAGQLISFTTAHVGNYGVSAEAMESDRIHARAAIMRAATNREDAPAPRAAGSTGCATAGSPASPTSTRARSCATSGTRARCAAASSRRRWGRRRPAR